VAAAVAELRSEERNTSLQAFTIEEAVDQQIEMLIGDSDPHRRSALQRADKIKQDLLANIDAMKSTPPEYFLRADSDGDANTPEEG
jgi:hypothetical protein